MTARRPKKSQGREARQADGGHRPVRTRRRQPLYRAMADRPRRRDHRQAPQTAADPCRAHRVWRRRRQRPCVHDRPDIGRLGALCCWEHLQPLSKYAMYAQNEQVHVGAWPSFSLYDPFAHALGSKSTMPRARSMRSRARASSSAPCAVVSQAMIDELCDTPGKACVPACRRRPCGDLWTGRQLACREASARPGRPSLRRYRSRHDRRGQERRRSSRTLFPARRHPAAAQQRRANRVEHFSLPVDQPRPATRRSQLCRPDLSNVPQEAQLWNPRSPSIFRSYPQPSLGGRPTITPPYPSIRCSHKPLVNGS